MFPGLRWGSFLQTEVTCLGVLMWTFVAVPVFPEPRIRSSLRRCRTSMWMSCASQLRCMLNVLPVHYVIGLGCRAYKVYVCEHVCMHGCREAGRQEGR